MDPAATSRGRRMQGFRWSPWPNGCAEVNKRTAGVKSSGTPLLYTLAVADYRKKNPNFRNPDVRSTVPDQLAGQSSKLPMKVGSRLPVRLHGRTDFHIRRAIDGPTVRVWTRPIRAKLASNINSSLGGDSRGAVGGGRRVAASARPAGLESRSLGRRRSRSPVAVCVRDRQLALVASTHRPRPNGRTRVTPNCNLPHVAGVTHGQSFGAR